MLCLALRNISDSLGLGHRTMRKLAKNKRRFGAATRNAGRNAKRRSENAVPRKKNTKMTTMTGIFFLMQKAGKARFQLLANP